MRLNILFLIFTMFFIISCASKPVKDHQMGMGGGLDPDLTDEQRQEKIQKRIQDGITACINKSVGDYCILEGRKGKNRPVHGPPEGSCQEDNNVLSCYTHIE